MLALNRNAHMLSKTLNAQVVRCMVERRARGRPGRSARGEPIDSDGQRGMRARRLRLSL